MTTPPSVPPTNNGPQWSASESLPAIPLRDGLTARFFTGEQIMFSMIELAPGAGIELHQHPHEQCGYMIAGTMYLTIGEETREMHPGDLYAIPGGTPHAAVGGPEGGRALDIFSPVREDYVALAEQFARQQADTEN